MTMADKIVVMHDGVVEQMGAPLDLYDKPQNLFVAGFIGSPSMNFIKGNIYVNGSAGVKSSNGTLLPLSAPAGAQNQAVVYGIRPEHLVVADDGLPAEVVVVEPTGSETQVFARLAGQEVVALLRERITVKPGDQIRLKPDARFVHLFDETTGNRI
jgi:multiple sugar transport system ATP-binding protein